MRDMATEKLDGLLFVVSLEICHKYQGLRIVVKGDSLYSHSRLCLSMSNSDVKGALTENGNGRSGQGKEHLRHDVESSPPQNSCGNTQQLPPVTHTHWFHFYVSFFYNFVLAVVLVVTISFDLCGY
ncbi:hypothetical protein IQ07DRAFT_286871 [Pyrenochaeta sp. DS3sAY3a]|nr:hypothetical protein IQ07DRAFT_286871 [Pyrenochaeta sp. DS3sAY3a]